MFFYSLFFIYFDVQFHMESSGLRCSLVGIFVFIFTLYEQATTVKKKKPFCKYLQCHPVCEKQKNQIICFFPSGELQMYSFIFCNWYQHSC